MTIGKLQPSVDLDIHFISLDQYRPVEFRIGLNPFWYKSSDVDIFIPPSGNTKKGITYDKIGLGMYK